MHKKTHYRTPPAEIAKLRTSLLARPRAYCRVLNSLTDAHLNPPLRIHTRLCTHTRAFEFPVKTMLSTFRSKIPVHSPAKLPSTTPAAAEPAVVATKSPATTAPAASKPAATPAIVTPATKASATKPVPAATPVAAPIAAPAAAPAATRIPVAAKPSASAPPVPSCTVKISDSKDGTWTDVSSNVSTSPDSSSTPNSEANFRDSPPPLAASAWRPLDTPLSKSKSPSQDRHDGGNSLSQVLVWFVCYLLVVALAAYGPAALSRTNTASTALDPKPAAKSTFFSLTSIAGTTPKAADPAAPNKRIEKGKSAAFSGNTHGLPTMHMFGANVYRMPLRAAGMRKKLFVPVYSVGIYFGDHTAASVNAKGPRYLINNNAGASMGLLLLFQRDVDMPKVVEALMSALGGGHAGGAALAPPHAEANKALQEILTSSTPLYRRNDSIEFYFSGRQGLGVSVNKQAPRWISSAALLRNRLMDVYVGQSSVVPELASALAPRSGKNS